ncbi:MAG: lysophospholipid acyltransferase family protein [Acidobacteriota bacterium]|nr:lysophospholipid acyltransferase family protein [Acidobacteriota bacterium]MDW3228977.1 lysophospholipid acyltransferase family protein [Acidobacteriota bacterium]MDY0232166.1 lysophospholipid acyltransferase family protein [Candidatus Saccharicenans sp.]
MGKNFEEELINFEKVIQTLSNMALFPKKLVIKGTGNFVLKGPNIIVGNHVGSYKDIAVLFKIIPRPIFFTANKMIFSKEDFSFLVRKHLYRSMKNFGLTIHFLLSPFFNLFIRYVSTNVAKIGTIPVDIYKGRAEALKKCQEYLKSGRAIITLQGRGHFVETDSNPYVSRFKYGAAAMAYNLYEEERLDVPVTPLAIFGTHIPLGVPAKIRVNVGSPMFISDYWIEGHTRQTLVNFSKDLEKTVKRLFVEILAS